MPRCVGIYPSRLFLRRVSISSIAIQRFLLCFAASYTATMAMNSPVGIVVVFALSVLYVARRYLQGKDALPLPPGPAGIPFLGNVNDMPKPGILECHHWLQHKDLYGPISSVTVLGQTFVIINDPDIAFELLRDRSAIHSSRPSQVFSGDMYVDSKLRRRREPVDSILK
jgi:hypothetical protein